MTINFFTAGNFDLDEKFLILEIFWILSGNLTLKTNFHRRFRVRPPVENPKNLENQKIFDQIKTFVCKKVYGHASF